MRRIFIFFLSMLLIISMLFSGCGNNATKTSTSSKNVKNEKNKTTQAENGPYNKQRIWRELGGWPKPPLYQGNPFASGGIGWPTSVLVTQPLYLFIRSTDNIHPLLAEGMPVNEGNKSIVKIRHGVTWNDGKPFTSKDVWAYYTLNNGAFITKFLKSIETPDDYTVVFVWNDPQPNEEVKNLLITQDNQGTIPYHIYGRYVDKAAELLKHGKPAATLDKRGPFGLDISNDKNLNDELTKNWQAFIKDNPKFPIGTGPFKVTKVTASDMVLEKRADYWDAKNVYFDKVLLKQVPDPSGQYAMLRSGQLEHFDGTQARDILESILASNKDLIHYRVFDPADMGFVFNIQKPPFNDVAFRRALIYAFDKTQIRQVANYYGKESTGYSIMGMPLSFIDQWVLPEIKDKMTKFSFDPDKATELLEQLGWNRGSDGIWRDKNDKHYVFVIGAHSDWAPNANGAQICAEQLTKFGMPTKLKAVDPSIFFDAAQKEHEYDMSAEWIDVTWGFNYPWWPLSNFYWGFPSKAGNFLRVESGPEKDKLNMVLPGPDGKLVDIDKVLKEMLYMKEDEVKKAASDLVWIANENAFGLDWFQNVTGDWFNMKTIKMKDGWLMQDEIQKYNRDMPLPTDQKLLEQLGELHFNNFSWIYSDIAGGHAMPR